MRQLLFAALFFCCYSLMAAETPCTQAVKSEDLEALFSRCLHPISGNLEQALKKGRFQHSFGTRRSPSEAASLIRQKAKSDDAAFQYIWGLILTSIYKNSPSEDFEAFRKQLAADQSWFFRAADQGHIGAMLYLIEKFTQQHFEAPPHAEKQKLLAYADVLIGHQWPKAHLFKIRIKEISSKQDLKDAFNHKLTHFDTLQDAEILTLVNAVQQGYYYSDKYMALQVATNQAKAHELLQFLVEERQSAVAALRLARLIGRKDRPRALSLVKFAANTRHPPALAWLGDYHACQGDILKARVLLKQALDLGHVEAEDSLLEIEDLGKPMTCVGDWVGR